MTDPVSYSTATPRLGLPMLFVGQTQKEATFNEALAMIDMIVGGGVLGLRNDPPLAPSVGQVWIVGTTPSGAFAGQSSCIAGWTEGGWRFVHPVQGMRVHDLQSGATRLYDGAWKVVSAPAAPTGGAVVDSEARAALVLVLQALKTIGIFSDS